MKTPKLFKEYIWLVKTIHQAGKISLADINEKWLRTDMSGGLDMARSTFNRHKAAIEDIFGIIIDCDRRDGYRYFIGNDEVLREDTVQNWILSTLSVSNVVFENLSLQDRILLETIPTAGAVLENRYPKGRDIRTLNFTSDPLSTSPGTCSHAQARSRCWNPNG